MKQPRASINVQLFLFFVVFIFGFVMLNRQPATPAMSREVELTTTPTPTATFAAMLNLPLILRQATPTPTATATATANPSCIPPAFVGSGDESVETAVYNLLTQHRNSNGLAALPQNDKLIQASRSHGLDMATNGFTSHTGSDGSSYTERIATHCYEAAGANEIIGWGFTTAESMVDWWKNSTIHNGVILSTDMDELGIGYIKDTNSEWTHYWTVKFARRATLNSVPTNAAFVCRYVVENELGGSSVSYLSTTPCE